MYSYVLKYNIEKSGFYGVSAYLSFFFLGSLHGCSCKAIYYWVSETLKSCDQFALHS